MKCEICGKDILENSQCIDYKYYHNDCIINLTKENQKLQTEKEQLNSLVNSCQEEIRRLKKQLENANEQVIYLRKSIERKEETIIDLQNERVPYKNEYVAKLENQQKEFIKYLEDEKDRLARVCNNICEDKFDEADDILQKYKAIIGDDK